MAKENLQLLFKAGNVFSIPQSTVNSYAISDDEREKILDTTKLFLSKVKNHFSYNTVKGQTERGFQNFEFVRMAKYPLPAVFNKTTRKILVNTNIFGKRDILNVDPKDLYSVIVYAYSCAYYTVTPLNTVYADTIADYMSYIFIKLFAKRYGLVGSYVEELPKLRFLVNLHVYVSYFNIPQKMAYGKAGSLAKIRSTAFDINLDDYDFTNTRDFIKTLSDSGVLHGMSLYQFVNTVIRLFNVASLPMFEDGMRFMSTVAGSTIMGNTIFPTVLQKYDIKLYNKIVMSIDQAFNR